MKFTSLTLAITLALTSSQLAFADDDKKSKSKKDEKKTIAQMIEKKIATEGLFDFYQDKKTGDTLMLINENQLDTPFLHFAQTIDGPSDVGHFRGNYRGGKIIEFRKYFNRIDIVAKTQRYQFDESNPISRAKDANISEAVLASIKIEKEQNGQIALKVNKLLLSEALHKVSPWTRVGDKNAKKRFKIGKLNDKKSRILSKRAYENNVDVVVDYVFNNSNPSVPGTNAISDPRSVSIKLQHSFIELPKEEFTPRYDDARVGYFTHQYDQMTSSQWTPYKDVIKRWNLVKKDPSAALSEPIKPVVWWIENTTPIEWRETIKEGVLAWNTSFEKAGFKNALQVRVQPDDATWDAADLNYNVLRWTSSPNPRFGGYGPSLANPLTGEMLGSDIMLEFIFMKNRWIYNSLYSQGASSLANEFSGDTAAHLHCSSGHELQQGFLLGQAMANNNSIEHEALLKEGLRSLVLHEVGHTLGLNHNMKASILWDEKEVHDKSKTLGILTGSVMDYTPINAAPIGTKQGDFFQTQPGPYDDWAIQYGYSTALEDPALEQARLNKILSRSNEKGLDFGNDADDMRAPGRHIDPRIMTGDLSSNPVAYAVDRMGLINHLLNQLKDKTLIDGQSYQQLLISANSLFGQYKRQANVISRQIGGVYIERNFVDSSIDADKQTKPYTPVPKAIQQASMQALAEHVFASDTLISMQPLYNYMQHQRRGFNHFPKNEDPKAHSMILNMQKSVLNQLLHVNVLKRISDTSLYGNEYSLHEILTDLTDAIFIDKKKANSLSHNIQIEYVKRLIAIAGISKPSAYDNLAKTAALGQLTEILDNSNSMSFGKNSTSKAHDAYISLMIKKALKV